MRTVVRLLRRQKNDVQGRLSKLHANGCTATASTTIQQPAGLSLTTARVNPACNGASTGSIDLTVSGGTPAYSYTWTGPTGTGPTTQDLSALPAGTYSVTVADANACRSVLSVTLTQPAALSLNASQQNVSCFGGNTGSLSLAPSGATAPFTYRWTTGATTQNLTALLAGTYSVTVTDASQCSVVQPFSVTQPAALSVTASRQHIACNGVSTGGIDLTVSGGKQPYVYAWSTGGTTQDLMALPAGSYSVVVTDANNCVATQTFSLTQPATLLPNLTKQNVVCNGVATGSISLAPTGGTGTYTYLWAGPMGTGATTQNLTGLFSGTYSVTVTDANNCTATASALLSQPTAITLTATPVNPACFGASNGSVDLTVSGGTPAYSYTWTGPTGIGPTTQDLSALPAGTYSVTVADANGCRAILTTTLTNPSALSIATIARNPACFGTSTGSVSLTATGGTGTYTYLWTTGSTAASVSGLAAGPYSVTITDANGCSLVRSVTLTNPPALTVTSTVQQPACFGAASGSINLTVAGGTGAYTYLWTGPMSSGAQTKNLAGIVAGTYLVTVTDANGCSQTLAATLTNPPALTLVLAPVSVACNGASSGLVSLTTTGGTGGYTYRWNTGSTSQSLSAVPAGVYSVTVTDANGCTANAQATVQQPAALTITLAMRPVSCFGGNDGGIGQLVLGGTGGYTYRWNTGESTSVLAAGTYSLTVTDANNCTGLASATVTQPPALSLTATAQQVHCFGGQNGAINITLGGGTSPYSFRWSDGSTTEDVAGLSAGVYSVTVTDANACTITTTQSLTQPTGLTATESHTNVGCTNGNNGAIHVIPSGGVAPYSYLWSTGATTQAISGLTSTTYTAIITDANGCQLAVSVPIIQPVPLTIQPDPSLVLCNAQPASIVTDTRGGTSPYSYRWSTGATTASVYGLANGTYSVVVADINGCTATTTATIVEPPPFGVAASVTAVACNNQSTGVISLKIEGATPPYALTMTNAANTVVSNSTLTTGLPAGSYSIKVVDSNSCVQSTTISVSEPPEVTLVAASANVPCFGDQLGVISLTATGGRTPFAYAWAGPMGNGATTPTITNLSAGTYSVVVTDANGCTATTTRSVTQPPLLTLGGSYDDVTCFGGNDGQITVTPAGGTLPYSYTWRGPVGSSQTTATNMNLVAGVYSVTVTDANGCSDELRFTISQPPALSVTAFPQNLSCFQNASGKIDLVVAGGTLPYSYAWAGPGAGLIATSQNQAGLAAGTYSVTVTDGHGCTEIRSVTLTQPAVLTLIGTAQQVACFGASTGSISLTVSGGTGLRAVTWSDGATSQNRTGLAAGTYSVSITDANECVVSQLFTITQPPALTSAVTSQSVACFGASTGSISLTVSGGVAPYSYSWTDGPTSQNRLNLAAGNYLVVVSDANGCQLSNGATLAQPAPLVLTLTPMPAQCSGSVDGRVMATSRGGTPGYTYAWTGPMATGATTPTITALPAGTYSLTVTDANNCTMADRATVTQPTALTVRSSQTNILCHGGSNGQAIVTASGGTLPYRYLWTTGATTASIDNVPAGVYSVTVTDANDCFQVNSFTLTEPVALSVAVAGTNVSCFGGLNGTASLTAIGGVGPYTYLWNGTGTNATAPFVNGLSAGTYSVTVTDANLCSAQESLTISQPAALTGSIAGKGISCYGGADGLISTTISGGTAPYSYTWTDASLITADRTALSIGTYSVSISDVQGCHLSLTQSLTQPTALMLTLSTVPVRCYGAADGVVSATASGGTPAVGAAGYSYTWSSGSTVQSLSGISAGTYSVTATDANGCMTNSDTYVDQPVSLSLTATTESILCFGGTNGRIGLDVSGGTGAYMYSWNGPAGNVSGTAVIDNLPAGVYSVTVTDANDCVLVRSFSLTQPPALSLSTTTQSIACFGGLTGLVSVTANGGNPMTGSADSYAYSWNTGSRTAGLSGLGAGVYSVTATDANQCMVMASLTLTQPSVLSIGATTTNIACSGGTDGAISLTVAGGTQPYTYRWTDDAVLSDRTSLGAGVYQVAVTDANDCQIALTRTLTQPDLLQVQINSSAVSCFGGRDGALSVVAVGGTPGLSGYTYAWSGPLAGSLSTSVATGLSASTYSVTVTDANQCSQTIIGLVTEPTALSVVGVATPASCAGGHDGTVRVTATGGTPLYQYAWAGPSGNGSTTPDQGSLVAGLYSVTVTDGNGCSSLLSLSVTEPPQLTITMALQNNLCEGDRTGRAEATVTGGTAPYSYTWTAIGQTEVLGTLSRLDDVPAGSYTLFVADANACRDTMTIDLTQPPRLALQTSLTHVSCFGGSDGAISTTLTGGTSPYSYSWTTSSLAPLPTTPTQKDLPVNAYVLKITDANGCRTDFVLSIGQPDALSPVEQITPVRCFSRTDGVISLTASGGNQPYSYSWRNANGTPIASTAAVSGLSEGIYNITLTDANLCTLVKSYTVTQPTALSLNGTATPVACFSGTDGAISVTVAGGNPGLLAAPYSYSWSSSLTGLPNNGQSESALSGLSAGAYSVTATDANGCIVTDSFVVGQPVSLTVLSTVSSVRCFSGIDGAVSLTTTGGTARTVDQPYTYSWAGPAITPLATETSSITGLVTGTYAVTVTDGNGCQFLGTYTVTQPTALSGNGSVTAASCFSGTNGTVSLTVTGGTTLSPGQPYMYVWSTGESASGISGLAAGVYSVTSTDANACSITNSFTVTQPTALSLTGSATDVRCFSGNDGTGSLTVTGGTPGYSYAWSNGQSTSLVSGLVAGVYDVTVTDGDGCSATQSLTISQPAALSMVSQTVSVNCSGGSDGAISLTVSGGTTLPGTLPYGYAWTDQANAFIGSTSAVSGLSSGAYSVTVTDGNNCFLTNRFVIDQPDPLTVSVLPTSVSCTGQPATVTTEVRGGSQPYSYSWTGSMGEPLDNGTTNATVVSLTAGAYLLTVTDANGCTATTPVSVSQPPPFGLNAVVKPAVCNGSATGSIDVTVEGATPGLPTQPYSYSWTGPTGFAATTEDLTGLPAGMYSLTVTDANGCREIVSFALTQADELTLTGQAFAPNCLGPVSRQDGQLLITSFDPAWRYAISEGASFTTVVTDPGTLPVVPTNGLLRSDLPNPTTALGDLYTIRVFTVDGCSKDLTLTLPQTACVCKPDICVPLRVRKTKR